MGLGKSLKSAGKSISSGVKGVVSGAKSFVKDPSIESAMSIASPILGGASAEKAKEQKKSWGQLANEIKKAQTYGYGSLAELMEAQERKTSELKERKQKASGLAQLIGTSSTLG